MNAAFKVVPWLHEQRGDMVESASTAMSYAYCRPSLGRGWGWRVEWEVVGGGAIQHRREFFHWTNLFGRGGGH